MKRSTHWLAIGLVAVSALAVAAVAAAQTTTTMTITAEERAHLDVSGYVQLDAGYDFKQTNPDWFDTLRTTQLPSFENQYGADGNTYFSVRQTRFDVKGFLPTSVGALKTLFEFDLFGVGPDAGQTTFHLRFAYGELGQWGAGQYWSPFADSDAFPNGIDYWGPPGVPSFRNVQIRWMPIQGDSRLTIALERPGASVDQGVYASRIELQDVKPHFKWPDLSAEYRSGHDWGYVEIAGIVRAIKWEDAGTDQVNLTGSATGWGVNLSSNFKINKENIIRVSAIYGEGVENYLNDAPVDIGIERNPGNTIAPIKGVALPVFGFTAFLDHTWNGRFSTAFGYSRIEIDNSDGQAASAFKTGQYGIANLLCTPVQNAMVGAEFQWGRRDNFNDGFGVDDYRIQVSFRYNYSVSIFAK